MSDNEKTGGLFDRDNNDTATIREALGAVRDMAEAFSGVAAKATSILDRFDKLLAKVVNDAKPQP